MGPHTLPKRSSPEQAIQRAVVSHLKQRATPGVFAWHTPNGGYRRPIEAAILKAMGTVAGIPDLLILKQGTLFALELKAGKNKRTPIQEEVHDRLALAGAVVSTATGLDEALTTLERWGVLRGTARGNA